MKYDAIVIGSGQAGNPLSHNLADRGWTVALVEHLGDTCINTGCSPTKTMVMCAQVAHYARNAAKWGVRPGDGGVDLAKIVGLKNKIVQNLHGLQKALEAEGMRFVLNANKTRVEKRDGKIALSIQTDGSTKSETVTGTHLLVATTTEAR
jgi:pyruvate/2-oxoglutarate dehydrogenase complex dihydrolipoamide dehydrogenase (E3) component